jgi:hypothetical protein
LVVRKTGANLTDGMEDAIRTGFRNLDGTEAAAFDSGWRQSGNDDFGFFEIFGSHEGFTDLATDVGGLATDPDLALSAFPALAFAERSFLFRVPCRGDHFEFAVAKNSGLQDLHDGISGHDADGFAARCQVETTSKQRFEH